MVYADHLPTANMLKIASRPGYACAFDKKQKPIQACGWEMMVYADHLPTANILKIASRQGYACAFDKKQKPKQAGLDGL